MKRKTRYLDIFKKCITGQQLNNQIIIYDPKEDKYFKAEVIHKKNMDNENCIVLQLIQNNSC